MSDWFLNGVVRCSKCEKDLWFSPEGYMLCGCPVMAFASVSAKDVERAFIDAITERLLNDHAFVDRVTDAANAALGPAGNLSRKLVAQSLLDQYAKIFGSANFRDKRKLALTLVKSVKIHPGLELEIEYNEI